MSDISFPVSEEPEADLASGDQALPMGVLGTHNERLTSGLDGDNSPHTSGEASLPVILSTSHYDLTHYWNVNQAYYAPVRGKSKAQSLVI